MGVTVIANARDVAMAHQCVTIDRMAGHGPKLVESGLPSRDILDIWPRFAVSLIGEPAENADEKPTGLCVALGMAPKILSVMLELHDLLYVAVRDLALVTEAEWRGYRGNLGYRSDAYQQAFLSKSGSESELTERRPVVRAGIYAAEAGANIAHTMFQYTRTDGIRAFEHPASLAVVNAATAVGWWECQGEWHPKLPKEPEFYWKPAREHAIKQFALRAAATLEAMCSGT